MPRASGAKRMTVEEYLEFEAGAEVKHELVDGFVFAMAGANNNYNLISVNLISMICPTTRAKNCRVYASDMKLRVPAGNYYYPDVFVTCQEDDFDTNEKVSACFIIEILSDSTSDSEIDRGEKLHNYLRLKGLKAYMLVSQKSQLVEIYRALENGTWRYETVEEGSFKLPCLDIELSLAEVYEDIELG
jgi:Uma2 family endonuclease